MLHASTTEQWPLNDEPEGIAGNNKPKPRLSQAECLAAIEHWTKTRRVADALSADEICELEPGVRLSAFARAKLEGLAHYFRSNPRKEADLGVYEAIFALSDNGKGYCEMGQERLGRFFGRGRQHINECIKRLGEHGLIRVESIKGAPTRLSPIVPKVFAQQVQTVWVFDALAPYVEPAKPGRKHKTSTTPISPASTSTAGISPAALAEKTPVTATVTPIAKYLSPNTTTPISTPVAEYNDTHFGNTCRRNGKYLSPNTTTQISYESPVVESERDIPRASSCAFSGLQAESADASAELFGPGEVPASIGPLPTKEQLRRWQEITRRWGLSLSVVLKPKDEPDYKISQWLKSDVKALGFNLKHEPEIINAALEMTLSAMEASNMDEPTDASIKGAKPAKNWFAKAFGANLDLLRQREHDARVHAKTVEAKAEIEVDGAKAANAKKLSALDHRIALGNDATVKRIESGAANGARMMNGASAPAAERFDERAPKVVEVCGTWITPFAANSILTDVPGSTKVIVFKALMKTGKHLNHLTKPGEDVILPHARRFTIFEVHGYPEARCGSEVATTGDYGRHFSSTWVCLSQKFVDGIVEKHKTSLVAAHDAFDDVTQRLRDVSAERYLTLQAEIEKKLEEKLAEREEREARLAEEAHIRREQEAKEREQREAQQAEDAKNFVWSDGKVDLSDLGRKALAGTDLDWATKLIASQDWIPGRKIPPSAFQLSDLWQELLRGAEFFPAALTGNEAFEELPF